MYVVGQGHEHLGPGTSLVQRINWTTGQEQQMRRGMGACFPEFAGGCSAMTSSCSEKGLGCGCGGECAGACGMGLFDSGLDFSQWGAVEWTLVAVGGYMVLSSVFATQRGVRRVRGSVRRLRSRRAVEA